MNPKGAILWRLCFLQASWNREGMQSIGMVVCALPWARSRGLRGKELADWMRPRLDFVNTNPYLAGLLLGSTLRLSGEGEEALAGRLQPALSRTLGALGDALSWEGARPAWAFSSLAAAVVVGPWVVAVGWLSFLLAQAALRWWGWEEGFRRGLGVVELLNRPFIHRWTESLRGFAGAALGVALVLALGHQQLPASASWSLAWAGAALACGLLGAWRHWPLEWILPAMAVAGWVLLRVGLQT